MDPPPATSPAAVARHGRSAREIVAHARLRQERSRTAGYAVACRPVAARLLAPRDGAFSAALAPVLRATLRDWKGP